MKQPIFARWKLCAAGLSMIICLGSASIGSPLAERITFSGQATAVRATVLGITTSISDTGPLPPEGGSREAFLVSASIPGLLTAEILHASTFGGGAGSLSEASVANLNLTTGGNSISADLLTAVATAVCAPTGPVVSGNADIVGLVINGESIVVAGQPNQTVNLPNGKVVINEQSSNVKNQSGEITVNALHVIVNGIADIVVSFAHADVTCGGNEPACDFVTGGGWITGTPTGAKGTFAVSGGLRKNGALWGHLTYIDHGQNGPRVKGTGVTEYVVVDATTRHIEGTCEINGQAGFTYEIDLADNGEPGRDDTFALKLSNGYSASGKLNGGNLQLHAFSPCP